jgi:hypothetical protein
VRPTQLPIQWVLGVLSLGVKRPEREADHSPPSIAEVKECVELHLHSPNTPSWRGAQLKNRTTLPYLTFTHGHIKVTVPVINQAPHEMYWGVEVYLHAFLPSALDGGQWSASRPGLFIPGVRAPATH